MILLLIAVGVILFLLFSRKGEEGFTKINRLVRDPTSNSVYTPTGEAIDFSEDEYIRVEPPTDPSYRDYIFLHTPTNVRVLNLGIPIPMGWQWPYYPYTTIPIIPKDIEFG